MVKRSRRYGWGTKTRKIEKEVNRLLSIYGGMSTRQIYYKLVSAQVISNTRSDYNDYNRILVALRRQGKIDPTKITDNTREIDHTITFSNPNSFLQTIKASLQVLSENYKIDYWDGQPYRVVIFSEKDALKSQFEPITRRYQVPLVVARGFGSDSQIVELKRIMGNKPFKVLMFNDHDPAGLCATDPNIKNSLNKRLRTYGLNLVGKPIRTALTLQQIQQYNLPSKPDAPTLEKLLKDKNALKYGITIVCELDALERKDLQRIIEGSIRKEIQDKKLFKSKIKQQRRERKQVKAYLKGISLNIP
jgi:hypothetical protein